MPQQAWNEKRERQYEHIKVGLRDRGDVEELAELYQEASARGITGRSTMNKRQLEDAVGRPSE